MLASVVSRREPKMLHGVLADDFLPLPCALIPADPIGAYAPFCLLNRIDPAGAVFAKIDCAIDVRHPRSPRCEIPGERKKGPKPAKKISAALACRSKPLVLQG